jgi:aromatic ring-opening dioxygenase catalytic subunit (LigB family)
MTDKKPAELSRRDAVRILGTMAAAGPLALATDAEATRRKSKRMPAVYLPHGGGPWPYFDTSRMGGPELYTAMTRYLKGLKSTLPTTPKALVVVSAHWEAPVPTVMSHQNPPMYYDYTGFPKQTYEVKWPAPGDPVLAARVRKLLGGVGIQSAEDTARGFDHGTFVPLGVAWPTPTIPTVQLSLVRGLDPSAHLKIGRALAPLRDEGVFIVGSGMSYHNMRGFFGRVPRVTEDSKAFDDWLVATAALSSTDRARALTQWKTAPSALACHPREEHLLPLMVIAGAAERDRGTTPYRDVMMGAHISAIHFG